MAQKIRRWRSPAYLTTLTRNEQLPPCPLSRYMRSKPRLDQVVYQAYPEILEGPPASVERAGERRRCVLTP